MVTPQKKGLEDLVKLARRLGLRRLRYGDVEFELGPAPIQPPKPRRGKVPAEPQDEQVNEDDADPLFDAVGGRK